jgi:hypothetical protein
VKGLLKKILRIIYGCIKYEMTSNITVFAAGKCIVGRIMHGGMIHRQVSNAGSNDAPPGEHCKRDTPLGEPCLE